MGKQLIETIDEQHNIYRDSTGIAWVEDTSIGCSYSLHPSIDSTGSIRGMKNLGYWGKADRTVRSHGYIYNIDHVGGAEMYHDKLRQYCRCGGKH